MTYRRLLPLLACLSGLVAVPPAVGQPPPKKAALVVQAFRRVDDLKDDRAAQVAPEAQGLHGSKDGFSPLSVASSKPMPGEAFEACGIGAGLLAEESNHALVNVTDFPRRN